MRPSMNCNKTEAEGNCLLSGSASRFVKSKKGSEAQGMMAQMRCCSCPVSAEGCWLCISTRTPKDAPPGSLTVKNFLSARITVCAT